MSETNGLELITLKEAAELLRIKPQTMRLYITNGRLPREFLCSQWHKRPLIFKDRLIEFIRHPEKYEQKLCL